MNELEIQHLFFKKLGGDQIRRCIQCGTCSASCPLTDEMDHAPRELFALIRDGEIAEALASNTPWYCVSCYRCVVRCPQEIPVIDLMYALKQLACEQALAAGAQKVPDLYRAFGQVVERYGRVSESMVMARYGMRHPRALLDNAPIAVRLLRRKRIDLLPQKMKRPASLKALLFGPEEGKKK